MASVCRFQEVVPLRARNVLGADKNRIGMRWNELVRAALNRTSPSAGSHDQQPPVGGGEKQKVHPVRDGAGDLQPARDFRCVVSKQMVGVLLTVWVRADLRRFVRRPSVSCVGCGVMGCLGNKVRAVPASYNYSTSGLFRLIGMHMRDLIIIDRMTLTREEIGMNGFVVQGAVSVRFWLHDTSFCFVCCHLASGGREGDEAHRNSDAAEILSRATFPRRRHSSSSSPLTSSAPHKILEHE